MNAHHSFTHRRTSLSSGLAVTALVVVVGVAAAVADFGPAGSAGDAAYAGGAIAPAVTTATLDSFYVPDALRIDASKVPPHVEAF